MQPPTFLSLPGEIRNIIYDFLLEDLGHTIIRNARIIPHPFAQVCRQTQLEFGSIFSVLPGPDLGRFGARTIVLQVKNFDFERSIESLERFIDLSATIFDVKVRVTKELDREAWRKFWSWVDFCDALGTKTGNRNVVASYSVDADVKVCNLHTARQMLYVEAVPYAFKSGGIQSPGYQQVRKVMAVLGGYA